MYIRKLANGIVQISPKRHNLQIRKHDKDEYYACTFISPGKNERSSPVARQLRGLVTGPAQTRDTLKDDRTSAIPRYKTTKEVSGAAPCRKKECAHLQLCVCTRLHPPCVSFGNRLRVCNPLRGIPALLCSLNTQPRKVPAQDGN